MKKIFILLISIFFIQTNMKAQDKSYQKEWKEVKALDKNGLPKSALKAVEKIYKKAKTDKNDAQIVKTMFYKLKYHSQLEDIGDQQPFDLIDKEIAISSLPVINILYSIKAEAYERYYNNNTYKILDRSNTINYQSNDVETLSANQILNEIIKNYKLSIDNAEQLHSIKTNEFKAIIEKGENSEGLLTSLYDFLAMRAMGFFTESDFRLTKSVDFFQLDNADFFLSADKFINTKCTINDSLSTHYQAIELYKQWLKLHINDKNKKSLTHIDLMRLQFVYENIVNVDKDKLYIEALKNLQANNENEQTYSEISYYIAKYYYDKSKEYSHKNKLSSKFKNYKQTAKQICEKAIQKYPKSYGAKMCKSLKAEILKANLNFKLINTIAPNMNFPILIQYKNIPKVYAMIGKIDIKKYKEITSKYSGEKLLNKLKNVSKIIQKTDIDLKGFEDYNNHSTELIMKGLTTGQYIIFISNNKDFKYDKNTVSYENFKVTNIAYVERNIGTGKSAIYVMNRTTGKPMQGVKAKAWLKSYDYSQSKYITKLFGEYTTDSEGKFTMETQEDYGTNVHLEFTYGNDNYAPHSTSLINNRQNISKAKTKVFLYTDRAIYRPGQTLYFKGIMLNVDNNKNKLLPNKTAKITLYDVNYKEVATKTLTSNNYGSFNGSFNIPSNLLNGTMHISCLNYDKHFEVEEYKRPKFHAEILPLKGNYVLNDSVKIGGKATAYSGAAISNAKVQYSVVRTPIWRGWWYCFFPQTEIQIAQGTSKTNEKGEFEVNFKAVPDFDYEKSMYMMFNYSIFAEITDLNGETQSVAKDMVVGYTSLQLGIDIDKLMNKDNIDSINISTQNVNSEFTAAKGELKIYSLKQLSQTLRSRVWETPDEFLYSQAEWDKLYKGNEFKDENNIETRQTDKLMISKQFDSEKSKKIKLSEIKTWKSGVYVAILNSTDAFGNKIEYKKYFKLYSASDNNMPDKIINWVVPIKTKCEPGEKAKFMVGSSVSGIDLLYEIEHKGKIIKKEIIKTSGKQKLIEIPVIEDYRGNIAVHFTFLYQNRAYISNEIINVPYTNKHLDIKFGTFRDKLQPGAEEQWNMTITGYKKDKVAAEMLASMYDASLDQFTKDVWAFDIYKSYYSQLNWNENIFSIDYAHRISKNLNIFVSMPYRRLSHLNQFGLRLFSQNHSTYSLRIRGVATLSKDKIAENNLEEEAVMDYEANLYETASVPPTRQSKNNDKLYEKKQETTNTTADMSNVKIRSNFNETAFFYPDLQTNAKGELIIKFKIPEALTTWKMRGFAYTKDLKYGFIEKQLKTQKDLMVVPNAPRFFRQYDKIEFPVKISNLGEKAQKGTVRLEFYDAITMQPINDIYDKRESRDKEFETADRSNSVVTWNLKIPDITGAIMYKVVAKSGEFSDGEQMTVPLLTNRILVSESLPLPIKGGETKTFKFNKLLKSKKSKSLKNFTLTLEFSSNPAWYAVQALPYLIERNSECNEQIFARYYANSIANHIANSSPKIKQVFDSWRNTKSSEALLSNLEKNQELKSALLEETPWVLQAENEQERKKRIALLFDYNKMAKDLQQASMKLQQSQGSNGGWAWFTGMPESRYITQYIVSGFGHLKQLGIEQSHSNVNIDAMLRKAVEFLDNKIADDYAELKRRYKKKELASNHLSHIAIQYLYMRSFFDYELPNKAQKAMDYYIEQSKKYWLSTNLHSQAMIALYLNRFNHKNAAGDIMKSLKENSITSEEMGMYWKNNTAGFYWYEAPIETQALMIEAFSEVAKNNKDVESLKIWLLKQKQTQDWITSKATSEAVYALLMNGSQWLESNQPVDIQIGSQHIEPHKIDGVKIEAGTGYFKTSWQAAEIKPEMGKVKLQKKDKGIAWGALYWQYFEDLDKITAHKTPLQLDKKLFVERATKSGKVIEPINKKTKLQIGDKVIVRIELRVDRDMEYLHLKDMRASGFELINVFSQYKYQGGLGYYESTKDASSNFYISYLPKGTYVFEYPLRVSHQGEFSNGISTIQCMYAPEFSSHSEGIKVKVK